MTTHEELKSVARTERYMDEHDYQYCCFCGKVLDDYDHDNSCRECE